MTTEAARWSGLAEVLRNRAVLTIAAMYFSVKLARYVFRAAGEGPGRDKDLDRFDRCHWHFCAWHHDSNEIAGAYRLADGAEQPDSYCETLFRSSRTWQAIKAEGVELGRSFVRTTYQRDLLPLLLLWQGIGKFVMQRPHIRYLFGPLSISADYTMKRYFGEQGVRRFSLAQPQTNHDI